MTDTGNIEYLISEAQWCWINRCVSDMECELSCSASVGGAQRKGCCSRGTRSSSSSCSPCSAEDVELPDDPHADAAHSSEEELEGFNCREREKRKWSQVKRSTRDSSCSSDEDMCSSGGCSAASEAVSSAVTSCLVDGAASCSPLQFRASPPAHAHKPGRSPPPSGQQLRGRSKRHRGLAGTRRAAVLPRPCLDLEKMQQEAARSVTTWRPSAELSLFCW